MSEEILVLTFGFLSTCFAALILLRVQVSS